MNAFMKSMTVKMVEICAYPVRRVFTCQPAACNALPLGEVGDVSPVLDEAETK